MLVEYLKLDESSLYSGKRPRKPTACHFRISKPRGRQSACIIMAG